MLDKTVAFCNLLKMSNTLQIFFCLQCICGTVALPCHIGCAAYCTVCCLCGTQSKLPMNSHCSSGTYAYMHEHMDILLLSGMAYQASQHATPCVKLACDICRSAS